MTRVYKNKNDRGSCLPQFYFALPLLLSCGQPRAHPRRCAPPPLYGAGVSSPPGRRQPGNPGSRDPVPGTPARYRGAPARGVDVKPSPGDPGTGVPAPWRGPEGPPGGFPNPGRGPGWPGVPGAPRDRSRTARRGGFYINPSRRGPAVPGAVPGASGPREGQNPENRGFWAKSPKSPFLGVSRQNPGKGPFWASGELRGALREGLM